MPDHLGHAVHTGQRRNKKIEKGRREDEEEASNSNSNLVLTTAEIHAVPPHAGYAGNAE